MSWITVDIDVDIDEFLSNCRQKDIQHIIEFLVDGGYLNKKALISKPSMAHEEDWNYKIDKLKNNKHQLSTEEESNIIKIVDRII